MIKKIKNLFLALICLFSCTVVYADSGVTVESITPVYDEASGIKVENDGDEHKVIFNGKNQTVQYNVVLKNNTGHKIKLEDVELSLPKTDFLEYTYEFSDEDEYIKNNETKKLILFLETVPKDGWGRNFKTELNATILYDEIIENPATNTNLSDIFLMLLVIGGIILIVANKAKSIKYVAIVLILGSSLTGISAKELMKLSININVEFNSQNVMTKSYFEDEAGDLYYHKYWEYSDKIKNFYIRNEITDISDYAYKFDVSEKQNGKVFAYLVDNKNAEGYYDLYLMADGVIYFNPDSNFYFKEMKYLDSIVNLAGVDTSLVTNMRSIFSMTGYNSDVFTLDISALDTSNVTEMTYMFYQTGYNSKNFVLNVSSLDTSSAVYMDCMFYQTGYNSEKIQLDVSGFDTSNVIDMRRMFEQAGYNNKSFTLDLSNFDTSNVTNMTRMFYQTGYNSEKIQLDVSGFDTGKVTDMSFLFYQAGYNNKNFTLDVSNFDTSNVTNMCSMFDQAGYNSNSLLLDFSNFNTNKVTNMSYMFYKTGYNTKKLVLDLNGFNTDNVTTMCCMFFQTGYNSEKLVLNVSGFNTKNVLDMRKMFYQTGYNDQSFNLDVSGFDTGKVTDISYMFTGVGFNSSNLNTAITIKNPNISVYVGMFADVAKKDGAQFKVNYVDGTEALVDKIVATKSSTSNVLKGVLLNS